MSNSALLINDSAEEASKETAATGQAMQSMSATTRAVAFATGVEAPMDVGGEEGFETEETSELSVRTPELESKMAMSSHTPTPFSIFSTVVSSSRVLSSPTPPLITVTKFNAFFQTPAILLLEMSQRPHPSLTAPHDALEQSTMNAQAPISSSIVAPSPFNFHLDPADMDFLKIKLDEW